MRYFLFFIIFAFPVFAQTVDVWIQYDATTGLETGTNSKKVKDSDLASLGRAQIEYSGTDDPTIMMVDITQNPPEIILNPALQNN